MEENKELHELKDDELEQVTGGVKVDTILTVIASAVPVKIYTGGLGNDSTQAVIPNTPPNFPKSTSENNQ